MGAPTQYGPALITAELARRLEAAGMEHFEARRQAGRMVTEEIQRLRFQATRPLPMFMQVASGIRYQGKFPDARQVSLYINTRQRDREVATAHLSWIMGMTDPRDVDEFLSTTFGIGR